MPDFVRFSPLINIGIPHSGKQHIPTNDAHRRINNPSRQYVTPKQREFALPIFDHGEPILLTRDHSVWWLHKVKHTSLLFTPLINIFFGYKKDAVTGDLLNIRQMRITSRVKS